MHTTHGARIIITVDNAPFLSDAEVSARVSSASIDVTGDFGAPWIGLTPDLSGPWYDQTAITTPGTVVREIHIPFTPAFIAGHPTDDLQFDALDGLVRGFIGAQATYATFTYSLTITDVVVP